MLYFGWTPRLNYTLTCCAAQAPSCITRGRIAAVEEEGKERIMELEEEKEREGRGSWLVRLQG